VGKWSDTSPFNRWFTIVSIACGILSSAAGPMLAHLESKWAAEQFEATLQAGLTRAQADISSAKRELKRMLEEVPPGHWLRKPLEKAYDELTDGYDNLDDTKKAAVTDAKRLERMRKKLQTLEKDSKNRFEWENFGPNFRIIEDSILE